MLVYAVANSVGTGMGNAPGEGGGPQKKYMEWAFGSMVLWRGALPMALLFAFLTGLNDAD